MVTSARRSPRPCMVKFAASTGCMVGEPDVPRYSIVIEALSKKVMNVPPSSVRSSTSIARHTPDESVVPESSTSTPDASIVRLRGSPSRGAPSAVKVMLRKRESSALRPNSPSLYVLEVERSYSISAVRWELLREITGPRALKEAVAFPYSSNATTAA